MSYRECLPENCPPETAEEITEPRIVYRLVWNDPPTDDDFRSQRAENPHLALHGITECQARGLSVFVSHADAERRSRSGRLQGMMVCEVTLNRGAGRIAKTGRGSHHTWWPLADFDITKNSRVVAL